MIKITKRQEWIDDKPKEAVWTIEERSGENYVSSQTLWSISTPDMIELRDKLNALNLEDPLEK